MTRPPSPRFRRSGAGLVRQSGMVLLNALVIVSVAAGVAARMLRDDADARGRFEMMVRSDQARQYALAAEWLARGLLETDWEDGAVDHLGETWAESEHVFPIGAGPGAHGRGKRAGAGRRHGGRLLAGFSAREHLLVVSALALGAVALLFIGIVEPLSAARKTSAGKLADRIELLEWMAARAAEVRTLRRSAGDHGAAAASGTVGIAEIEASLGPRGLRPALTRLTPRPDGRFEARFEDVSYK